MYIRKLQSSGLFERTARIHTLKTEHAHLLSPLKNQARKFANEVREKATMLPDRVS